MTISVSYTHLIIHLHCFYFVCKMKTATVINTETCLNNLGTLGVLTEAWGLCNQYRSCYFTVQTVPPLCLLYCSSLLVLLLKPLIKVPEQLVANSI